MIEVSTCAARPGNKQNMQQWTLWKF